MPPNRDIKNIFAKINVSQNTRKFLYYLNKIPYYFPKNMIFYYKNLWQTANNFQLEFFQSFLKCRFRAFILILVKWRQKNYIFGIVINYKFYCFFYIFMSLVLFPAFCSKMKKSLMRKELFFTKKIEKFVHFIIFEDVSFVANFHLFIILTIKIYH